MYNVEGNNEPQSAYHMEGCASVVVTLIEIGLCQFKGLQSIDVLLLSKPDITTYHIYMTSLITSTLQCQSDGSDVYSQTQFNA